MLHHESKSPVDTNAVVNNNQITNIPQKAEKTYLEVIPADVTMNGKTFKANALLDAGSDATLITKDLADKLCLQGPKQNLRFMNAITSSKIVSSNLVSFSLSSPSHPQYITVTNAWVVEELDTPTPKFSLHHLSSQYSHLSNVPFTPLTEKISILIGADMPELHLHLNYKLGKPSEPVAIETKLGWVIFGGKQIQKDTLSTVISNKTSVTFHDLNENVEKFWKVESYSTLRINERNFLPKDEQRAYDILETTTQNINNRYEVGMLWKSENPSLQNNRSLAVARLLHLEKKFKKDPVFAESYKTTINDYITQGHASKLPEPQYETQSSLVNYVPHHGVTSINKPGKVRVVFDGAAKFNETCLNENLLKGPDLLNNLFSVLLKFRSGRYALTSDIKQMFHQVRIIPSDRDALRFLWRYKVNEKMDEYVMNVHLFGKTDSPCCANWSLKRTALDQE